MSRPFTKAPFRSSTDDLSVIFAIVARIESKLAERRSHPSSKTHRDVYHLSRGVIS